MIKLITLTTLIASLPTIVHANPACIVCTVAIGASLEISRKLGINDNIVGLWTGALLALLGFWSILWFDKKGWNFKGRNSLLMILSLSLIFTIYTENFRYTPKIIGIFYMDSFLFSALIGAGTYICSQKFYQWMKDKNGGHAHFPFEKVIIPLIMLISFSILFELNQF